MARMIKYDTVCFYCNNMTKAGEGFLQRTKGKWFCHCRTCYDSGIAQEHRSKDNANT